MYKQYLPKRQKPWRDSMREIDDYAGTRLKYIEPESRKQFPSTRRRLSQSQLSMSCEKFPYRRSFYTQSEDDVMCTMRDAPSPTSCGSYILRSSTFPEADCLSRREGTMIRSVIPLPYISSPGPCTLLSARLPTRPSPKYHRPHHLALWSFPSTDKYRYITYSARSKEIVACLAPSGEYYPLQ